MDKMISLIIDQIPFKMDHELLSLTLGNIAPDIVPYAIIIINCILFKLARSFINSLLLPWLLKLTLQNRKQQKRQNQSTINSLIGLFINELISTCELCADCAELNVVYDRHGSIAYGLGLGLLTYLWYETFGDAHTTPGYMLEDTLIHGYQFVSSAPNCVRLVAQLMAVPMAWRFASFYWKYQLLKEHTQIISIEHECHSSLATSTIFGAMIEFICSLMTRCLELTSQVWVKNKKMSSQTSSLLCSFVSTLLVVLALDLSGGYFNPILAASLEFGCKGIDFGQHLIVFWLGPLFGHLVARLLFENIIWQRTGQKRRQSNQVAATKANNLVNNSNSRRVTRSLGVK